MAYTEPALHTPTLTRNGRPMHPVWGTPWRNCSHIAAANHTTLTLALLAADAASGHTVPSIHTPRPPGFPCFCALLSKPPSPR